MSAELVVENASLYGRDRTVDIGITSGTIEALGTDLDGETTIDAAGGLVAGGFLDPHAHVDKSLLAGNVPPNESGTLEEAIVNNQQRKTEYTVEGVRERAVATIESHVANGCTRLRTHVDVDSYCGLTALDGVLEAVEDCQDIAEVQVIAFPQEGIVQDPGTVDRLREALERGADLLGGMPDNERIDADRRKHVDICLDLAAEYEVPLDLHVDETDTPNARSLEYLATRVLEIGFDHGVTAGHMCSLAAYDDTHANRVINLVAESGLKMVTNPPANLLVQGVHDSHPKRRGTTRVDELLAADITVAAGQDGVQNGFYPYGRGSMLEVALITAHATHLQAPSERATAWEMVTGSAAAVMDLPYGIESGKPAVLNVFSPDIQTYQDALSQLRPPRFVLHHGDVVATNEFESTVRPTE